MIRFAANFQPKLNELHKHLQNQQKSSKYASFLVYLKLHNPFYHSVSMAEEMKNSWLFRSLTSIYMEEGR